MIRKVILSIIGIFGLFLSFGSEGAYNTPLLHSSEGGRSGDEIIISHTAWEDSLAATYLIENLLTQSGYSVELVQLDPAIMFSSIATGQSDFSVSPWFPYSHGAYYEQFEDRIEYLGAHATGAVLGLAVPEYMDVDSISELTTEADQILTGVEPGAGLTEPVENAFERYPNLNDWEHIESSTGAMLTQLQQAIQNEEEIVTTLWRPHWVFIEEDLKLLEDPENAFGEGEELADIARLGFSEDYPEVYEFVKDFEWPLEEIEQVMFYIGEGQSPEQATARWMDDNPEQVDEWLSYFE